MKIAIVGCGYIGTEVAKIWNKKGQHVTATTRRPERLEQLSAVAQKGQIWKGTDEEELVHLIADNEVFLVSIGADAQDQYENAYLKTAQLFRHLALEMDLPRHLIYTGSTSVYGDHHGLWVDEESLLKPNSDPAKILQETEKAYLSLSELGWHVCVLRLAEIYGPGRELSKRVRNLENHTLPGTGDPYTNMVHKADCALAIDYALKHNLEGIFNLADDDHPTRKELYDQIAQKFRLPKVHWDPAHKALHHGNKRVSNHKIKAAGYAFKHPHRELI